jgi:hypothetical protein
LKSQRGVHTGAYEPVPSPASGSVLKRNTTGVTETVDGVAGFILKVPEYVTLISYVVIPIGGTHGLTPRGLKEEPLYEGLGTGLIVFSTRLSIEPIVPRREQD